MKPYLEEKEAVLAEAGSSMEGLYGLSGMDTTS